jgi:uncharacterized protein
MANLSPELIAILRCPVTGSSLVQEGSELVTTGVGADGQKRRYPIEQGIPLLLPPDLLAAAREANPRTSHSA